MFTSIKKFFHSLMQKRIRIGPKDGTFAVGRTINLCTYGTFVVTYRCNIIDILSQHYYGHTAMNIWRLESLIIQILWLENNCYYPVTQTNNFIGTSYRELNLSCIS